jgi:hypothetical protein
MKYMGLIPIALAGFFAGWSIILLLVVMATAGGTLYGMSLEEDRYK